MTGIVLSILSAILLTAGFPKPGMFYLSWAALAPLLVAVRGASTRRAFALGYLCGFVHNVSVLFWIRYAVNHYGGFSQPASLFLLALLCAYLAVYAGAFALIARKLEKYPALWLFGSPFVWVGLEWVRAAALSGFPWTNLAYTQTPVTLLIQIADITGTYGVSWLIVFASMVLTGLILKKPYRWAGLACFAVLLGASLLYGSIRPGTVREAQELAPAWNVAVIQGNIDQAQKWDPAFQLETLERYRRLSVEAAARNPVPDLLLWPETAVPFFYGIEQELTGKMNDIVREAGKPILFGSPAATRLDGQVRMLNRAYLVDGKATLAGAYAKRHLVPFGEYVPMARLLFFVHKLTHGVGDNLPGDDPSPLVLTGHRMGVLICYEIIFPELSRDEVLRGAGVLMNLTNDAWYGDTSGPYQHLEMARWRAIEFRRPVVRAANTGVSAIFDAVGQEQGRIALNREGSYSAAVRPMDIITVYARYGDVFAWGSTVAGGGILVFLLFQSGPISRLQRRKLK
jgi:apolipoprotein N-acyltransferase